MRKRRIRRRINFKHGIIPLGVVDSKLQKVIRQVKPSVIVWAIFEVDKDDTRRLWAGVAGHQNIPFLQVVVAEHNRWVYSWKKLSEMKIILWSNAYAEVAYKFVK